MKPSQRRLVLCVVLAALGLASGASARSAESPEEESSSVEATARPSVDSMVGDMLGLGRNMMDTAGNAIVDMIRRFVEGRLPCTISREEGIVCKLLPPDNVLGNLLLQLIGTNPNVSRQEVFDYALKGAMRLLGNVFGDAFVKPA